MHPQMKTQSLFYRKSFLAIVADVNIRRGSHFLIVLGSHVVLEGASLPECLVAFSADIRALIRVDSDVFPEIIFAQKAFLARFAFKSPRLFFGVCHLADLIVTRIC